VQVLKTSVAAVVAWLVCDLLFAQPPIFAAIAALLVVQPSVNQSLSKGIERSVGVIAGVALAFGAGYLFGTASWVVLATIVVALLLAWVLRLGPGSSAQIPISAMLVLSIGGLTADYAVERVIETVIGAVVGLAVNLAIVPPVQVAPAHLAIARLQRDIAVALEDLAGSLEQPMSRTQLDGLLAQARLLRPLASKAAEAVTSAKESLTLNPRAGRLRLVLTDDEKLLARLSNLVTRVLTMTRTVHDNYDPTLVQEPTVGAIAAELRRAAHDLRLLGRDEPTVEDPALTSPLVVLRPHAEHWILIGSLLEDIRRVRQEVTGEVED
jgi:uncharacterized membrane protein YccC